MIPGITGEAGLIKTKFGIPVAHQYLVSRPRLQQKLGRALARKLTLVVAPAGYGKTTAVSEWLAKSGLPAAWLTIDAPDNNPLTFWQYLATSLNGISPGLYQDMAYVFSVPDLLQANVQIQIIVDRLSEVEREFFLVLDDMHLLSNPQIIKSLAYFADYLPPRLHLIMISRAEPELDLIKLEIKSQLLRITVNDLRFRADEIFRFYELRNCLLDSKSVQEVEGFSEGWAAALVALAMSIEEDTGCQDILSGMARSRYSLDQYLMHEVIGSWPGEKRDFVLRTSILDSLCSPLCDAVTAGCQSSQILQEMSSRCEFLVPLDHDKLTFRYNQLFRDFLYKTLQQLAPGTLSDLHARAAGWYLEQGLPDRAISHYLSGMIFEEASRLIECQLGELASRNAYDVGIAWLEQLPRDYLDRSPRIAAFYSLYYSEQNRFDLAEESISRAEALLLEQPGDIGKDPHTRIIIGLTKANLLLREGNAAALASLLQSLGKNEPVFQRLVEYFDFNRSDIYLARAPVQAMVNLAGEHYQTILQIDDSYHQIIMKDPGYRQLALGEYLYEKNLLDEAIPHLLEAHELAKAAGSPGVLVPALVDIARIRKAHGDIEGVFSTLAVCADELKIINKSHWNYLLQAFKIRQHLDAGQLDSIKPWLATNKLGVFSPITRVGEFELIVFARALLAVHRIQDAELLLLRLLTFAESENRLHSLVEILNLLAILTDQKCELARAMGYMEKSLQIGIAQGYFRSYIDEREPIIDLLRQAIMDFRKRGDAPDELIVLAKTIAARVQSELRSARPHENKNSTDWIRQRLTTKELRVLELLFGACTNEEISLKLNISLRTVKSHTSSIYSKLRVASRAQCLTLLREMHYQEWPGL